MKKVIETIRILTKVQIYDNQLVLYVLLTFIFLFVLSWRSSYTGRLRFVCFEHFLFCLFLFLSGPSV